MLEHLLRDLAENRDVASLDVVSALLYTLNNLSKSGYERCRDILMEALRRIIDYNLRLKYNLTENQREEKLKILDKFYLQGLVSYRYSEELLSKLEVAEEIFRSYAEEKLKGLNELEKKVLSFILHSKPKFAGDCERYYSFESFGYTLPQMTIIF